MAPAFALTIVAGAASSASGQDPAHAHRAGGATPHAIGIPQSVRDEHADIRARLERATEASGEVGMAARELVRVLHPHFVREEQIALPPLGLLQRLARGERGPEMMATAALSDSLKAELSSMLADDLAHHARTEEEVTYPAAILVGELLHRGMPGCKMK